jgi:sulfate adenylyltransferase
MSGGFSPLRGFMTRKADYEGVCHNMRLASGVLWPMPITLDVTEEFAKKLTPGSSKVALRDAEGVMLASCTSKKSGSPTARPKPRRYSTAPARLIPAPNYTMNNRTPGMWADALRVAGSVALRFPHAAFHSGGIAR